MFLKGIIMILIGLTGIVGTITWFIKSIGKKDKRLSYEEKEMLSYTNRVPNSAINEKIPLDSNIDPVKFNLGNEESTVLLDEFSQYRDAEETVLLDEDGEYFKSSRRL